MKFIKYSKYSGDDFGIDAQDLMKALSDFLLQSGFQAQFSEWNSNDLEDLKQAIQRALESGELFPQEQLEKMLEQLQAMSQEQMDQLVQNLVQKLVDEGHLTLDPSDTQGEPRTGQGGKGPETRIKFEVTDKSLDFLGYKTLKDLLGSLGKSSFGRHDTRDLATGIESSGSSKQYEFGDTMNLDISETLFSAVRREGLGVPINLEYRDLHVHQCEYQSSCATVLMLDCSHSMILYGEDRFTPAKKVALALAHLIKTQYPGDSSALRTLPRTCRGTGYQPAGSRPGGSVLHQHAGRFDPGAAAARPGTQGHEADHHDHRWQTVRADARRWADVPQCLRSRSAGHRPRLSKK